MCNVNSAMLHEALGMSRSAPAFQNASKCSFCDAGFGLLTRKHHCRNCGQTACDACTKQEVVIPDLDFATPVRVCKPCYALIRSGGGDQQVEVPRAAAVVASASVPTAEVAYVEEKLVANCTCNMPLCICVPDAEEPMATQSAVGAEIQKTVAKPAPKAASTFSGFGFGGSAGKVTYDLKGDLNEQCRDAVKSKVPRAYVCLHLRRAQHMSCSSLA
jgi:hypothetical protein